MAERVTVKQKPVRRKVIAAERTYGRVPGWIVDLDCGHHTEVIGWGDGAGIACPKTTICPFCSGRRKWKGTQ